MYYLNQISSIEWFNQKKVTWFELPLKYFLIYNSYSSLF